jgi:predicted ester cyclase
MSALPRDPHVGDANVVRYRAFVDAVLQQRRLTLAEHFLLDGFVEHDVDAERDRAGFLARLAARHAAFPDGAWTVEFLAAIDDFVVCQATMRGRARGVRVAVRETVAVRFAYGRMAEAWRTAEEGMEAPLVPWPTRAAPCRPVA